MKLFKLCDKYMSDNGFLRIRVFDREEGIIYCFDFGEDCGVMLLTKEQFKKWAIETKVKIIDLDFRK